MKKEDYPILYAVVNEEVDGVQKISFVNKPATKQKFVAFNENEKPKMVKYAVQDPNRRIATGVIMLADTPLFTYSEGFGYYYAVYNKEAIEKMAIKFAKNNLNTATDMEHRINVDGATMFESFIIDSSRGVKAPVQLGEITEGSWIGSFYIENQDLWSKILDGTFQGFSLAGTFFFEKREEKVENSSGIQKIENEIDNLMKKILQK